MHPPVLAIRQTTDGVELDLDIVASLPQLEGHFPDLPIVPGVALLDWVVRFSAAHLAELRDGTPRFQIKFRRVLQPGARVTLLMRRLVGDRVQFEYRQGETIYASGILSPPEPT